MLDGETRLTILRAIEKAVHAQIKEQERLRTILNRYRSIQAPDHLNITLDGLDAIMTEQDYPPTPRQLNRLGITLARDQGIAQVDDDISTLLQDLSQISDHTTRMKAAAHFWQSVGAYSEDLANTFSVWAECAALKAAMNGAAPTPAPA